MNNLVRAEQIARDLPNITVRVLKLVRISMLWKGNMGEAERVAQVAKQDFDRCPEYQHRISERFWEISKVYFNRGQRLEAERVARAIPDGEHSIRRLLEIAFALARKGDLIDAERIALSLPPLVIQSSLLAEISTGWEKIGNYSEAFRVADSIPNPAERNSRLDNLSRTLEMVYSKPISKP